MRVVRSALVCVVFLACFVLQLAGQAPVSSPQSDSQTLTSLQAVAQNMGVVPSDATLNGSITLTAGALTESGTITISTKGTSESLEQISSTHTNQTVVYSNGSPSVLANQTTQVQSMEKSQSSQSVIFPLPILL